MRHEDLRYWRAVDGRANFNTADKYKRKQCITVSRYNCAKDAAIKESTAPAMKKDKNKIHISMQIEIDV